MSSSTPERTAAVLTVSDSCSRGEKTDLSGPAVAETLERRQVSRRRAHRRSRREAAIQEKLIELCRSARLVVTTGGTGVAPRDVTPEATRAVSDRLVDGIPELMRSEGVKKTRFAALSRGVCGTRGTSLILNLARQSGRRRGCARFGNRSTAACARSAGREDGARVENPRRSIVVGR